MAFALTRCKAKFKISYAVKPPLASPGYARSLRLLKLAFLWFHYRIITLANCQITSSPYSQKLSPVPS
jgi:hypothetical protein